MLRSTWSSTFNSRSPAVLYVLETPFSSAITGVATWTVATALGKSRSAFISLIQVKSSLGVAIKPAPDQFIQNHHVKRHHRDAADDQRRLPFLRCLGNKGSQTVRLKLGVTPNGNLRDDACVPSPPGGGTGARDPKRKDSRKNQRAPSGPSLKAVG